MQPHGDLTMSIQSPCQIAFSFCKQTVITKISQLLQKYEGMLCVLHQLGAAARCFEAHEALMAYSFNGTSSFNDNF